MCVRSRARRSEGRIRVVKGTVFGVDAVVAADEGSKGLSMQDAERCVPISSNIITMTVEPAYIHKSQQTLSCHHAQAKPHIISHYHTHNNLPPLIHFHTSASRLLPIQRHASIMPRPVMVDMMYDLGHYLRESWIVGCKLFLCHGDAGVREKGVGDEGVEAVEGEGEWEDEEEDGESEEERS
jgi:hypothetical protein